MSARRQPARYAAQKGAALLVMLSVIVLGTLGLLLSQLNSNALNRERDAQTMRALAEAKELIMGWSLVHPQRPGLLPFPDRNADGNYDGAADCPAGAVNNTHLLGKLPWANYPAPCVDPRGGLGGRPLDESGETPWYAVSRNLVYNLAYPTINSDLTQLNTGWITVFDEKGALLSNRVAFVVMAPGRVLPGQNRGAAAPAAANYLDSMTLGATVHNNADTDQSFIAATSGSNFNDRLLYVTIDEFMSQVENAMARRVERDARACLDAYAAASGGKYPWAAVLNGGAAPDYTGDYGAGFGRIPLTLNIEASPGVPDAAMQAGWQPATCFSGLPYWNSWREQIFYQVAPGYRPGSAAVCPACLTLNGGGNYRAHVLFAGRVLSGQARVTNANKGAVANYLEGDNANGDLAFENQPDSASFDDRVFCVDGGVTCN